MATGPANFFPYLSCRPLLRTARGWFVDYPSLWLKKTEEKEMFITAKHSRQQHLSPLQTAHEFGPETAQTPGASHRRIFWSLCRVLSEEILPRVCFTLSHLQALSPSLSWFSPPFGRKVPGIFVTIAESYGPLATCICTCSPAPPREKEGAAPFTSQEAEHFFLWFYLFPDSWLS